MQLCHTHEMDVSKTRSWLSQIDQVEIHSFSAHFEFPSKLSVPTGGSVGARLRRASIEEKVMPQVDQPQGWASILGACRTRSNNFFLEVNSKKGITKEEIDWKP